MVTNWINVNYATPVLDEYIQREDPIVDSRDTKYFTLFDNNLSGEYHPITGYVGIWSKYLSDENGGISMLLSCSAVNPGRIYSIRLISDAECYPTDFVITLYDKTGYVVRTLRVTGHNSPTYQYFHSASHNDFARYIIAITKVSKPNSLLRVYNIYEPFYLLRTDTLRVSGTPGSVLEVGETISKTCYDTLRVSAVEAVPALECLASSNDALYINATDAGYVGNVHSAMKRSSRRVYGKVYITYTDPMLNSDTAVTSDTTTYNSSPSQVMDGIKAAAAPNLFTLYDNDLSGHYVVSDIKTQVGWSSSVLSDANGYFEVPPVLTINFAARPVLGLPIVFNDAKGCIVEDFSVKFVQNTRAEIIKNFTGNTAREIIITDETLVNVVSIEFTFYKVSKAGHPASVLEVPIASTILYTGYKDESNLISVDLLEELTYEDEVEALGGVSANEVTVILDNSNKDFYFNNALSPVASQLKRNRKIVPWLGTEVVPGEIEWYTLGTFWSYRWDVPVNGLTASVVGFDTIGLLDTTSFTRHHVQINKSVGELIEYVLADASLSLDFIEYVIDPALYDIVVPYAWFASGSHTAALRKISGCYPMHIYCDRQGRICAAPQKLHLDYYYDTWSDSTNVIDKKYSSLYTTLPNIINITVVAPMLQHVEDLARDDKPFSVAGSVTKTLNFSKPYVSDIDVSIDSSVDYTYEAYSWGIVFTFTGNGVVNGISCSGTAVDISNASVISSVDEASVHLNGAVTRDIQSDFIQSEELASTLINRILSLSSQDKYDAEVTYRGDIALTINDPILLLDGIAPDNRYNIKRHQLFWNGSLTGTADLNT